MRRHYVRSNKAWYWEAVKETHEDWIDEVYFYNDEPWGEMAIRWIEQACSRGQIIATHH